MCDISRRGLLVGGSAFLSLAAEAELLGAPTPTGKAESGAADLVASDVYFHEGHVSDLPTQSATTAGSFLKIMCW